MDRLVIDIETKNTFNDVGGERNVEKLDASLIGVYSYAKDQYLGLEEHEFDRLEPLLAHTELIIGFAVDQFDIPVMRKYFKTNIGKIKTLDMFEEVKKKLGRRVGLGVLCEANLHSGKNGKGLDAIEYYRSGEIEKLKHYCLNDVKITKELYEFVLDKKKLFVPDKFNPPGVTFDFDWGWSLDINPQEALF
ncbi:MAG: hypothetical protein KGI50_03175 [Patescibacteria group bacterium]|nr:hypothetical protein [Patescibacteria group bacterium]MDE2438293.1 hypothetical protein [Patescibacteria group bacterium]